MAALPDRTSPRQLPTQKQIEYDRWINTSRVWLDRFVCRWLTLCGLHHIRPDPPGREGAAQLDAKDWNELFLRPSNSIENEWQGWERLLESRPELKNDTQSTKEVPPFVLQHAPLVHLSSKENFWPADPAEHIRHMAAILATNEVLNISTPLHLGNMDSLSASGPQTIYLTSLENIETRPDWLVSHKGIPFSESCSHRNPPPCDEGAPDRQHRVSDPILGPSLNELNPGRRFERGGANRPTHPRRWVAEDKSRIRRYYVPDSDGFSGAPSVLILVEKESAILDAFWFFFFSYNFGRQILGGPRFGNHVGDWEYAMIRFHDGIPITAFLSKHRYGESYNFNSLEKRGKRPVVYCAEGSHALYPSSGDHPYGLPFGMLKDSTDHGLVWDILKNMYAYYYNINADVSENEGRTSLTPAASNPDASTSWFHFDGWWGDKPYDLGDRRQWSLFGQSHYGNGPTGPKFKNLARA